MLRRLTCALLIATCFGVARADNLDDPLHGYAVINGVVTNTDNGAISPIDLGGAGVNGFGFAASPAPQTGTLLIDVLLPTNLSIAAPISITGNVGAGAHFVSMGTWGSGDLAAFLSLTNSSPANPFATFAGSDSEDIHGPPAGFTVWQAVLGTQTLEGFGSLSTMVDNISNLSGNAAAGALITGFLIEGGSTVSTAPSGVLMQDAAAVPGPIVGAGLPGILTAVSGLWMLGRHRRRQRA